VQNQGMVAILGNWPARRTYNFRSGIAAAENERTEAWKRKKKSKQKAKADANANVNANIKMLGCGRLRINGPL
jgi:hypothetical protein